jgi:hypothetical protein
VPRVQSAPGRRACDVAVTLCVPPRAGELCAPVRFLLRQDSVVMELTARHRITSVEWDQQERAVAMVVEITDPQTARPVDVRIDVVEAGAAASDPRTRTIGTVTRDGREYEILGTYLGVVADEN